MKPIIIAALLGAAVASNALAQSNDELSNLSVEDLMKVEVTSVARRGQRLSETAAATFVISEEDIHRSGATSIPDLLRMVPGFDVAQINRNLWAVSARGFNGRWSNKLLVLIDGRTVYSELFGGVRWDVQDLPLDDIERIEVTRGPGGTLSGANAVNGIVNIVTKHPVDTHGLLASVSHGDSSGPSASVRYGGRFGTTGHFRATVKGFDVPATLHTDGSAGGNDDWQMLHGAFRAEWTTRYGSMNVQGDVYRGRSGETIDFPTAAEPSGWIGSDPNHTSGHNLLFRWSSTQSPHSETTLTAYYDEALRNQWEANQRQRTFDVDFAHHVTAGRHNVMWGLQARSVSFRWNTPSGDVFLPSDSTHFFSAFVQDEIRLTSSLRLIAGSKLLRDDHLNEAQPSIRALWMLKDDQVIWAAATRSVRLPSETERDVFLRLGAVPTAGGGSLMTAALGNPDLRAEYVHSIEIGYRGVLTSFASLDITAYRNELNDLTTIEPAGVTTRNGEAILPLVYANAISGTTRGLEASLMLRPAGRWDLAFGFTHFGLGVIDRVDGDPSDELGYYDAPHRQYSVRSFFTVSPRLEIDGSAYYVGSVSSQDLPRYVRLDARVAWQARPGLELSVSGRNLAGGSHLEFRGFAENAALTPASRTIAGMILWRR
jgi:iron complex outermembrane receptor protein